MNSKVEDFQGQLSSKNIWAQLFLKTLEQIEYGHIEIDAPHGEFFQFSGNKDDQSIYVNVKIHDWKFCEYLFTKGDIGLGESYIDGLWEAKDIATLIKFGIKNAKSLERVIKGSFLKILFYRVKHLLNKNTVKGSKRNILAHYDIGNDFYKLWLDRSMTYSSGLFLETEDLYQAQMNKYQRIIDELGAMSGDHILEIGCGWGGFAKYASSKGIKVTGITISNEQYQYAKEVNKEAGDFVDIKLMDYRNLEGRYDFIASIEMFEALGESYWATYFNKLRDLLTTHGKAVVQSITINNKDFKSYRKGTDFIQQYIFPGGMLPSVEAFEKKANSKGLSTFNRLDFGKDYAKTLRHWNKKFHRELASVSKLGLDENFVRMWRFYFKYCEGGFDVEKIGVSQFTITKKEI
jgi:cyclopropane-fatty-acyl-phospholipid synthase